MNQLSLWKKFVEYYLKGGAKGVLSRNHEGLFSTSRIAKKIISFSRFLVHSMLAQVLLNVIWFF